MSINTKFDFWFLHLQKANISFVFFIFFCSFLIFKFFFDFMAFLYKKFYLHKIINMKDWGWSTCQEDGLCYKKKIKIQKTKKKIKKTKLIFAFCKCKNQKLNFVLILTKIPNLKSTCKNKYGIFIKDNIIILRNWALID